MALVRSSAALELVRQHYEAPSGDTPNMILTSAHIRPAQKAIIDGLSAATGMGKAEIVRGIVDEWCEFVLAEQAERA